MLVGEHDLARRHMETSIRLNRNDAFVVLNGAFCSQYLGDLEAAAKWREKLVRVDPLLSAVTREVLFDNDYMTRRYADAIGLFRTWHRPPVHIYGELAAACAQLGRMEDAQVAVAEFEQRKPAGYDFAAVAKAHARMCARREDAEHWLGGYRKAGLLA
jgi:Flp pilus assembly protein TadD